MDTQETTQVIKSDCCPPFIPELWQEKEITWNDKKFVKGNVKSFWHMPLNMGSVITNQSNKIKSAGAELNEDTIMLSDESSAWSSDQYISVNKEVPGCTNVAISGTFLTKVYEGPYRMVPKWHKEIEQYVASKGKEILKLYTYYTTCPKCAKIYGKNYVVLFAQV